VIRTNDFTRTILGFTPPVKVFEITKAELDYQFWFNTLKTKLDAPQLGLESLIKFFMLLFRILFSST
jgi:hypothetical protein